MEEAQKRLRKSSFADDWGGEASLTDLTREDIETIKNQGFNTARASITVKPTIHRPSNYNELPFQQNVQKQAYQYKKTKNGFEE